MFVDKDAFCRAQNADGVAIFLSCRRLYIGLCLIVGLALPSDDGLSIDRVARTLPRRPESRGSTAKVSAGVKGTEKANRLTGMTSIQGAL